MIDLARLVSERNVEELKKLLTEGAIVKVKATVDGAQITKLMLAEDYQRYAAELKEATYFNMLQGVRKVLLNSSYGATLNEWCRFYDPRLGASCTGTGRQITTFMLNTLSAALNGPGAPKVIKTVVHTSEGDEHVYDIATPPGQGPIYSDTDSAYFTMSALTEDLETAVGLADQLVSDLNQSFVGFMGEAFNCQPGFDNLIRANREIVAVSGIFQAKKKYILLVHDSEGKKLDMHDPKALKSQGSDIKISTTPEQIRTMLKTITMMILTSEERSKIEAEVLRSRRELTAIEDSSSILEYATVAAVKTLDDAMMKWERVEKPGLGKVNLHSTARAVINHNVMLEVAGDQATPPIRNGQKVKIVWLKPNDRDFTNIAFASETEELPSWFNKYFEVDLATTEKKLIDGKLRLIFSPLGWDVPTEKTVKFNSLVSFD